MNFQSPCPFTADVGALTETFAVRIGGRAAFTRVSPLM